MTTNPSEHREVGTPAPERATYVYLSSTRSVWVVLPNYAPDGGEAA